MTVGSARRLSLISLVAVAAGKVGWILNTPYGLSAGGAVRVTS